PGQSDGMVLRHGDPVDPERGGGPQQRTEVPGILQLVEREKEGRAAAGPGNREERVEINVLSREYTRHDALMLVGAGHRGELIAGPIRHLDAGASGKRDDPVDRAGP